MTNPNCPTIDEIQARTRAVLAALFGPTVDHVATDAMLPESLDRYDSLGALECVTAVEKEFSIEVDFVIHDVRHAFSRVDRIAEFVRNQLEDRVVFGDGR